MALPSKKNPSQLYPESILSEPIHETKWYVAHTKSRREKALANYLVHKQIGYCLPLMKMQQPNSRRERYSFLPLFRGYLFFKGHIEDRYCAYTSNHIATVLEVRDQEKLRKELIQVYRVLSANAPLYPYDFLSEGQRVKIKDGPMKDLEGIIDRKKGDCSLILTVTSIFQSFAVHVDASMVEAV